MAVYSGMYNPPTVVFTLYMIIYVQVHLKKLEYREKVVFFYFKK